MKSFYKDDVLGYVTSSNSIPWLYDLESCCAGDVTVSTLTTETDADGDDCKVRAEYSMFSLSDPSVSKSDNVQSNQSVQSGEFSRQDVFMKSFTESMCASVIDDAVDAGEWKLFVPDGAAVSKLTKFYVRNVAVLGVAMMLSQAPFYGVRNFQSSLNGWSGRWALVAYHVAVVVSTPLVGSAAVSARVRPKTAVILSVVVSLPFTVVAAFHVGSVTSVLLPVTAAVAGAASMWLSEMQDTYITSLGASCALLSDDHRDGGRPTARHFTKVFSQYLLVMQQLSLLVGNFATSAIYLMTQNLPEALSTRPTAGRSSHVVYLLNKC